MMLKVLLTCEDYLPSIGGAEVCVMNVAKELRARGHRVTTFTNTVERTDDETGVVRVPWRFTPAHLWRNVAALWRLIGESDIVHCTYSFRIAAICGVLATIRRRPVLLTQQGKGIVPEVHPKWHHTLLVTLCRHVSTRCASHITATSDEILELTARFVPREKITMISNGYDARWFTPDVNLPKPPEYQRLAPETKIILSVRRLVPKNGIHILVQALSIVRESFSSFHYFAIGEGRARPFIEALIRENDLTQHVTLAGARDNHAVKAYLQHADLVVIPSSAEARSIACIEAMGMGKPIIASRVGGLIDLLGKDSRFGELVTIYDSEACTYNPPDQLPREQLEPLVNVIVAFLRDPKPLQRKAAAGQMYVRAHYGWNAITAEYEKIYERLLNRT